MQEYKLRFVDFMLRAEVLRFGQFVTKSGRDTPFFINTGLYSLGSQINELAGYYAEAILARGVRFDFLFGPAYKGIPLVVAIAGELARRGHDIPFCFNRKEAKTHGEGGTLVGHTPTDGQRALIVEDVTTAGTSIRETVPLLKAAANVELAGLIVSVDRQERGSGARSALAELRGEFGMDAFSIVTITEVVEAIDKSLLSTQLQLDATLRRQIDEYRAQYGGTD